MGLLRNAIILLCGSMLLGVSANLSAQAPAMFKRTTTKTDKFDFGAGGSVSIAGAPSGSVRVTGSSKNEIEITAEIEVQAPTEADADKLASVTTFLTDESLGRAAVITTGTHNKLGGKKLWRKFPKVLMGLPFRIDYTISVPRYCDLQIDAGNGDITVAGVEGMIRINSSSGEARVSLVGGGFTGTFGSGSLDITMPDRSWRGNAIDVQLNSGTMTVHLPFNLSAELDATVLRTGMIENTLTGLKERNRNAHFTDRMIAAKAGSGGVSMKFTVGDGTLLLVPLSAQ